MKVCKKCKKQVANKSKICKYCGSDVSKSKIIKPKQPIKKEITIEEKPIIKIKPQEETIKESKQTIKKQEQPNKKLIKKEEKPNNEKKKKTIKKTIILLIIIVFCLGIIFGGIKLYKNIFDVGIEVKDNEETQVFEVNDTIKYKGILYEVINVTTTEQGSKYKKPKKGNHYVIITLKYKNKSDKAIRYSAKCWKMEDQNKQETSRIFTTLDVKTAIYGGKLVIGSSKEGTLTFEVPKDNKNLKLNFYNLDLEEKTKPVSKEEQQEELKPLFSINIDIK